MKALDIYCVIICLTPNCRKASENQIHCRTMWSGKPTGYLSRRDIFMIHDGVRQLATDVTFRISYVVGYLTAAVIFKIYYIVGCLSTDVSSWYLMWSVFGNCYHFQISYVIRYLVTAVIFTIAYVAGYLTISVIFTIAYGVGYLATVCHFSTGDRFVYDYVHGFLGINRANFSIKLAIILMGHMFVSVVLNNTAHIFWIYFFYCP